MVNAELKQHPTIFPLLYMPFESGSTYSNSDNCRTQQYHLNSDRSFSDRFHDHTLYMYAPGVAAPRRA